MASPETALFEEVCLEDIEAEPVRAGFACWNALRGERAFPRREELRPHAIKALLRYFVLIRVVDGGRDFHMSIVGDAVQRAYDVPLHNRYLSEIVRNAPAVMPGWMERYRRAALSGKPLFFRVTSRVGDSEANFIHREVVILPLGSEGVATHVMTFGTHERRLGV